MLTQEMKSSITDAVAEQIIPFIREIAEQQAAKLGGDNPFGVVVVAQAVIDLTASTLLWSAVFSEAPPEAPNLSPAELTPDDAREACEAAFDAWESWEKYLEKLEAQEAETSQQIDSSEVAEGVDAQQTPIEPPTRKFSTDDRVSALVAYKVVPTLHKALDDAAVVLADDDIFYHDRIADMLIYELTQYLLLTPLNIEYPHYTPIRLHMLSDEKYITEWFNVPVEAAR